MSEETSTPAAAPAPPVGRAMRTPVLVVAILIGLVAIVLARHYKRPDPPKDPPAPGMTVGSDSVTLANDAPMWNVVKVAKAEAAQPHWTDPVPARVVFDEARTSRLGTPLSGRVTSVTVERGQKVTKGSSLFTVSSPNLAELRAEQEKAIVEKATAQANYNRIKDLVNAGSLPGKELIQAEQELREGELAVKLAGQKLASLNVAGGGGAAAFTVTAPRDGVIVEKSVAVGQSVDASAGSLMAIADLSDVWVVADLFENDVGSLAPGAKAKVSVGSIDMEATVDQVAGVVDPERHTVPVRVRLVNSEGTLRPNAYAQIRFFDPTSAKVALPASAVMSDGATSYIYIKTDKGELKRRDVVVGSVSGGKVPVIDGVEVGDQVVVQGAILLDNQIQLDN
jgi:cobalt-zinc-cadmium efflux system membrane fusion protein